MNIEMNDELFQILWKEAKKQKISVKAYICNCLAESHGMARPANNYSVRMKTTTNRHKAN